MKIIILLLILFILYYFNYKETFYSHTNHHSNSHNNNSNSHNNNNSNSHNNNSHSHHRSKYHHRSKPHHRSKSHNHHRLKYNNNRYLNSYIDKPLIFNDNWGWLWPHNKSNNYVNLWSDLDNKARYNYVNLWSDLDTKARYNYDCAPLKIIDDIIIVKDTCEGLPHTQNNNIIIPEYYYNNYSQDVIDRIIKHERIHIHQKQNYQLWKEFYEKEWSYTLSAIPPDNIPYELIKKNRINPDTFFEKWACYLDRYYSIPIYNDETQPNIKDTNVVWWDKLTNTISNEPPKEWLAFFHKIEQLEHPNEISAVYLSTPTPPGVFNSIAYDKLINYLSNKLN